MLAKLVDCIIYFRYGCTKSGHVFEIHYKTITVKRTWHVLPSNTGGVSIRALVVHEVFCVTGSDDGVLRVWPPDFSTVFMEAGMYMLYVCVANTYQQ